MREFIEIIMRHSILLFILFMRKRRKILFFVKNISMLNNHVLKLSPYLHGCEILAFHNSKMQNEHESVKMPVRNIDVSCLSYREISEILDDFSPDVCILFNFRGIIDQFFMRVCRERGMKVIFLAHGMVGGDIASFKGIGNKNLLSRMRRVSWQIRQYASFVVHSSRPLQELGIFCDVLFKDRFSENPFDKYLVYGRRCLDFLAGLYGLEEGVNACVAGYPLFDDEEQKRRALTVSPRPHEYGALYVHQPFILDGRANLSYEEERDFVLEWADRLMPVYGNFTLLLHPREDLGRYASLYGRTPVRVIQSPNDYLVFMGSGVVLGHYSTALLFPLYLDIPAFIIDYPAMPAPGMFRGVFPFTTLQGFVRPDRANAMLKDKGYMLGDGNSFEHIAGLILGII